MEKIKKIIQVKYHESFFFDADDIIDIRKSDYLGFWNGAMKFNFNSKTKKITIFYETHLPDEKFGFYQITYHSLKDERKLKLEKLNEI